MLIVMLIARLDPPLSVSVCAEIVKECSAALTSLGDCKIDVVLLVFINAQVESCEILVRIIIGFCNQAISRHYARKKRFTVLSLCLFILFYVNKFHR